MGICMPSEQLGMGGDYATREVTRKGEGNGDRGRFISNEIRLRLST